MQTTLVRRRISRYEILSPLGSGGIGTVYLAREMGAGEEVAVKVIRPYVDPTSEQVAHFLEVQKRLQGVAHPWVTPVLDVGVDEGQVWLAMPRIPGESIRPWVERGLPFQAALRIGLQVVEALTATHEAGVLHGDLKLTNVLLDEEGNVQVTDFGMALLGMREVVDYQSVQTTPAPSYMSPEQVQGKPLDERSDVYSLGVLLYELLTGEVPYWGYTPLTVLVKQERRSMVRPGVLNPAISRQAEEVVLRALALEPEKRYPTAAALATALRPLIEGATSPALSLHERAALEVEQEEVVEENLRVVCQVCGHGNLPNRHYCSRCFSRIHGVELISVEEVAQREAERLQRKRWTRWMRVAVSVAVVVVSFGSIYAHQRAEAPRAIAPPSSNVSSLSEPQEWAMMGGGPTRSGYTPALGPQKGQIRWSLETEATLTASVAVQGGRLYLPTGDRRLMALRADTGQLLWQVETTGPVDSTPAVADGVLYLGFRDTYLRAIRAQDGQSVWEFKANGPITTSAVVSEGVVYFGSGGGTLYALDAKLGTVRWVVETGSWLTSSPAVNERFVALGGRDGSIYTVEHAKGAQPLFLDIFRWPPLYREGPVQGSVRLKYTLPGGLTSLEGPPILAGTTVYAGANDARFRAVDGITAVSEWDQIWVQVRYILFAWFDWGLPERPKGIIWAVAARDRVTGALALTEGALYGGSWDGRLYALVPETGEPFWGWSERPPTARERRLGQTEPVKAPKSFQGDSAFLGGTVVAGSTLYAVSYEGTVYALDAASGEKRWTLSLPTKVQTAPAVAGGLLYVTGVNGTLYAIE